MKNWKMAVAPLLAAATLCVVPPDARAESDDVVLRQLQRIFREHPELVLDTLRSNSEAVLEIAQQGANARRRSALERQWRGDAKVPKEMRLEGRPVLGSKTAKVRIVVFSDFTCSFCQQSVATVNSLLKAYGDDVSFVFKAMPLSDDPVGTAAVQYFAAIGLQSEEAAWRFHDALFDDRDALLARGEARIKEVLATLKGSIDVRRVEKDRKGKKVQEILSEDMEDGKKLGVEGTPFFLVNNLVIRGALPLDLFKMAVDMAREGAGK